MLHCLEALTDFVDLHELQLPSLPRFLVLVNPFSGPGRALHIFQQSIVPVFAESGLQYHLLVTGVWCIFLSLVDRSCVNVVRWCNGWSVGPMMGYCHCQPYVTELSPEFHP